MISERDIRSQRRELRQLEKELKALQTMFSELQDLLKKNISIKEELEVLQMNFIERQNQLNVLQKENAELKEWNNQLKIALKVKQEYNTDTDDEMTTSKKEEQHIQANIKEEWDRNGDDSNEEGQRSWKMG